MTTDVAEALVRSDEADPVGPYYGHVIIEWAAPLRKGEIRAMPAWACAVIDAETGKYIVTVSKIKVPGVKVTADVEKFIVAELTMFADDDGRPVLFPQEDLEHPERLGPAAIYFDDEGKIRTGVFPFIVAEMRVRGQA